MHDTRRTPLYSLFFCFSRNSPPSTELLRTGDQSTQPPLPSLILYPSQNKRRKKGGEQEEELMFPVLEERTPPFLLSVWPTPHTKSLTHILHANQVPTYSIRRKRVCLRGRNVCRLAGNLARELEEILIVKPSLSSAVLLGCYCCSSLLLPPI